MTRQETPQPELRNPPVVEIYADFRFEGGEQYAWDHALAQKFLAEQITEPGRREVIPQFLFQPKQEGNQLGISIEQSIDRVRTWSKDGQLCVQIAENRLIVNRAKKEAGPHFRDLLPDAGRFLEGYSERFTPKQLTSVSLGYVDDVRLPAQGVIDLKQYFTVWAAYPERFGHMSSFSIVLRWEIDGIPVKLDLTARQAYVFRFTWLATSVTAADESAASADWQQRLERCHTALRTAFFASFTPRALELFQPEPC